jgi:hypothetical protein
MSTETPVQEAPRTAADVCQSFEPGQDARGLLRDEMTPKAYFSLLVQKELYDAAVQFTARWLSKREAVWWGCLCAWDRKRPEPPEAIDGALGAAVRWVLEPSEENRRAARAAGKEAGAGTAAGSLALAAFYSEGSISYPDLPEVAPPSDLTARTVAIAVGLAARQGSPSEKDDRRRQFLQMGLEVALGKNPWDEQAAT